MAGTSHMGYMGHARIGGTLVKISNSSINPVQNIEAPELIAGDWNKRAWVFGKIETGGSISGPVAENTGDVWDFAWKRDTAFGDRMLNSIQVDIAYYKGVGRSFADCQINSYELSVNAGDVAQFNIDFMGTKVTAYNGDAGDVACEKLVTWDVCSFTATGISSDQLQAFSFTVNNNLQRIYKLNQATTSGLFPAEILAGIRDISGSLSFYADDPIDTMFTPGGTPAFGADSYNDYEATDTGDVTVTASTVVSASGHVAFSRAQVNAQTGPVIYTVAFTGVCAQTE